MNMVYASTYMCFLQFLSSVSYNFLSAKYLLLGIFDAIINGIVFSDFLSDSKLLVYKNTTDFWKFILYLATLLNSYINSCRGFLVDSLGFSKSSANKESFTFSFPIWMPFISSRLLWYDFQYYAE